MSGPRHEPALAAICVRTAEAFRLGEEATGSSHLAELVDRLAELAAQGDDRIAPLGAALAEIVQAQGRGDFLRVADVLEFVVGPALGD
jgi:hypothetical protein